MHISTKFSRYILSLIFMNFARMSANGNMKIVKNGLVINFGIIWNTFSPLVIVYGISFLFAIGLRGAGGLFAPEFFVFIFLSWINFLNIIQTLLSTNVDQEFYKNKDYGNLFVVSIASVITSLIQCFARFFLTFMIILFLDFEIKLLVLLTSFFLISTMGMFLGFLLKFLILNNTLLNNLINFCLQAMFFLSNIIFPVSIFPENIQEYLYFNPLVHINEFVRESYLESYGGLVDMSYAAYSLFPLVMVIIFVTLLRLDLILRRL